MKKAPIIGVVGLGAMGLGIAQTYAQAGFTVIATDGYEPARLSAMHRLSEVLDARVAAGKMTAEIRDDTLGNFQIVAGLKELNIADIIIEAIVENLDAKQKLFAELESFCATDTVLATNTSSLSIASVMRCLQHPDRGVGLHFFNPAPVMKLVELVRHHSTSVAALNQARQVTEAAGKTVFLCSDTPGFIVNRCARPFYGEALAMLEEGRNSADIDAAMVSTGYRMGPFSLIDLVGADINLAASQSIFSAMRQHPRYYVFDALKRKVAVGQLGRKSGRGFVYPEQIKQTTDATIVLRIEATLANEAASLISESGISEDSIDAAMKLGLNFPRGPFESARRQGLSRIKQTLTALEHAAPAHLKGRYVLAPALEKMT